MIEASQKMINEQNNNNPIVNKHLELEIKTLLQNAPRDVDKLERLLKVKGREKDEDEYIEDTQRPSIPNYYLCQSRCDKKTK